MIRVAKRLRLGGRDLGLLLINVQAARMLKEFADNRGKAADHIMLFNQDGYWLHGRTHPGVGLHARAPGSDSEADFSPGLAGVLGRIKRPDGVCRRTLELDHPVPGTESRSADLESRVPGAAQRAAGHSHSYLGIILAASAVLLLLFGAGVAALVRSRHKEQLAQQEAARLATRSKVISLANT